MVFEFFFELVGFVKVFYSDEVVFCLIGVVNKYISVFWKIFEWYFKIGEFLFFYDFVYFKV